MLRQWDDVAKSIQILSSQGINIHLHFDGVEDAPLAVKLVNEQDIKQWDGYIRNLRSSRISEKCSVFPKRKEYVSMDRTEICMQLDGQIDNVLGAENSSYTNTFESRIRSW